MVLRRTEPPAASTHDSNWNISAGSIWSYSAGYGYNSTDDDSQVSTNNQLTGELANRKLPLPPGEALRIAMHFQQVTGPVMAKGCEDTAFYRYARLVALNEVGGDPRRFGLSLAAFHHQMRDRVRAGPRAMVTTATHDTKRGEDARVRLALLSEMPREWGRRLMRWRRFNRSCRGEVDDGHPQL